MDLTENAEKLFRMLYTKDFNAAELETQLESGAFSADDINQAAYEYVEYCTDIPDYEEYDKHALGETIPGIESSHLLEAIRILLDYGLDPNASMDQESINSNIMYSMLFVENGYQAADAAKLMLEHGGNPNIVIAEEDMPAFMMWDFWYFLGGDVESRYIADSVVHYIMVYLGFGAKWRNGDEIIKTFGDFKVSDFIDHRKYYYGIVRSETEETLWVSFFEKATNREVARYTFGD